jgi:mRNA interferase MazF
MTVYEFGDILLVDFPHSGSEQAKRRPALVILDIADADVLLAPITTRERTGPGDIKIQDWQEAGLLRESWARLAKVASLEKRIVTRRLGRLSGPDRRNLALAWRSIFEHLPSEA